MVDFGHPVWGEWLGRLLVALQFALLAWLGWTGLHARQVGPVAWSFAAAAFVLGLWALGSNRPGNFNIRPTPRPDGRMVSSGPYRWIRHPMYSAVLLFGVACAWTGASTGGWIAVLLLAAVLVGKAALEERWMLRQHPGYGAYRASTARFVPGLF